MNRIDAHQHFWRVARADYGWLTPRQGVLYRDFEPEELAGQLVDCQVNATVLVQAAPTEVETRFLFELARQHTGIAGVVGWVDFEAPDVSERMAALIQDGAGKLKGLRPMVQDIADAGWLLRSSLDTAFAAMLEHDLAFDALVTPLHLDVLRQRLHKHPTLRVVLDHAGKPDIAGGVFKSWATLIEQLASTTSSYCKLSGLLTQAEAGADMACLEAFVAHIFTCFGAERVIWGSDWPVLTLRASYREWLDRALELVQHYAPEHGEAVFSTNAIRFYRLDLEAHGS